MGVCECVGVWCACECLLLNIPISKPATKTSPRSKLNAAQRTLSNHLLHVHHQDVTTHVLKTLNGWLHPADLQPIKHRASFVLGADFLRTAVRSSVCVCVVFFSCFISYVRVIFFVAFINFALLCLFHFKPFCDLAVLICDLFLFRFARLMNFFFSFILIIIVHKCEKQAIS